MIRAMNFFKEQLKKNHRSNAFFLINCKGGGGGGFNRDKKLTPPKNTSKTCTKSTYQISTPQINLGRLDTRGIKSKNEKNRQKQLFGGYEGMQ